jgi:hypothetical protein
MKRLRHEPVLRALRDYLREDVSEERDRAKRAVLAAIPQRSTWYFCELDGESYAVRVLRSGRIEVMRSIFDDAPVRSTRSNGSTGRSEELRLSLFQEG